VGALLLAFLCSIHSWSQQARQTIKIDVHANQEDGTIAPIWSYFGYDEPNYSYAPNGKKLLAELAALSPTPVYVRVHNLLTSGDGSSSLKWGSTNAYTEDSAGRPIYSWAILDQIFDAFHSTGVKPLVEIGFMPEALSTHPQPYRHNFPNGDIYTGWAYPPKDYQKWSELVFQFVRHLRERYGEADVKTWLWEVWNEPDIGYWNGTPEEYFKLYDVSVDAVLRALPGTRIGGPDTTGPASPKAAEFLRLFLEHCAHQNNYATGKTGPIWISFRFTQKAPLSGRETMYKWALHANCRRLKKAFASWHRFRNGEIPRSFLASRIRKAAPPARRNRICKIPTATDPYMRFTRPRSWTEFMRWQGPSI
jgi:xylan 1,4-beta-xylosidase